VDVCGALGAGPIFGRFEERVENPGTVEGFQPEKTGIGDPVQFVIALGNHHRQPAYGLAVFFGQKHFYGILFKARMRRPIFFFVFQQRRNPILVAFVNPVGKLDKIA